MSLPPRSRNTRLVTCRWGFRRHQRTRCLDAETCKWGAFEAFELDEATSRATSSHWRESAWRAPRSQLQPCEGASAALPHGSTPADRLGRAGGILLGNSWSNQADLDMSALIGVIPTLVGVVSGGRSAAMTRAVAMLEPTARSSSTARCSSASDRPRAMPSWSSMSASAAGHACRRRTWNRGRGDAALAQRHRLGSGAAAWRADAVAPPDHRCQPWLAARCRRSWPLPRLGYRVGFIPATNEVRIPQARRADRHQPGQGLGWGAAIRDAQRHCGGPIEGVLVRINDTSRLNLGSTRYRWSRPTTRTASTECSSLLVGRLAARAVGEGPLLALSGAPPTSPTMTSPIC
jgi:hypothetical protein